MEKWTCYKCDRKDKLIFLDYNSMLSVLRTERRYVIMKKIYECLNGFAWQNRIMSKDT